MLSDRFFKFIILGVDEATQAFKIWKAAKERKEQQKEEKSALKPAPYKFVKVLLSRIGLQE